MLTNGYGLAHSRARRAAVMPFVRAPGRDGRERTLFLVGRDVASGELTDLGGGRRRSEFALSAALREFREESGGAFEGAGSGGLPFGSMWRANHLVCCPAVVDKWCRTAVLFVEIPLAQAEAAIARFERTREVQKLLLVSRTHLTTSQEVWTKVRMWYRNHLPSDEVLVRDHAGGDRVPPVAVAAVPAGGDRVPPVAVAAVPLPNNTNRRRGRRRPRARSR
jgi:hypothetical protein